jgi:outer membrane protein
MVSAEKLRRCRGPADEPRGPPARVAASLAPLALACCLLAGCRHHAVHLQPEVSAPAIQDRLTIPPHAEQQLEEAIPEPVIPAANQPARLAVLFEPPGTPFVQGRFTLDQAVAYGLENNPRLRATRAAIERARGQRQVAYAPYLPELDFESRYVATSFNLSPGSVGITGGVLPTAFATHNFAQSELALQWTVCDFGRTAGRYGQAVSVQRICELQNLRALQTTEYSVTVAYLNSLSAQAGRRVQEQALRTSHAVLSDTRHIREGGVADLDDVLRAEVQLSEVRESVVAAQQAEFDALGRLNYALGRNAALPLSLVDLDAQPSFDQSLVECLQIAAYQRREVAIAREAVAAAQQGYNAAKAENLPQLYIRGSLGRVDGQNVANGFQEGAGIHLDQSLYSGGRRRGTQYSAAAEIDLAVAEAQSVLDGVTLEVNLAYRAIAAARQRIELANDTIASARENLRLVRVKYANGDATPTDVVDAETTATRSELRLHAARYGYLAALAGLQYALGGPQELSLLTAPSPPPPTEILPAPPSDDAPPLPRLPPVPRPVP